MKTTIRRKASKKNSKSKSKSRVQVRPASAPIRLRRVDEVRIERHGDELRFARPDELIAGRPGEVRVTWVA